MYARIVVVLLAFVLGFGATACGGEDEVGADTTATETVIQDSTTTDETTTVEDEAFAAGRAVFVGRCGGCHTLAEAGTSGTVGPNLDDLDPAADRVETQVRNGGGGMPAFEGDLAEDEIEEVSEYVAEATGG